MGVMRTGYIRRAVSCVLSSSSLHATSCILFGISTSPLFPLFLPFPLIPPSRQRSSSTVHLDPTHPSDAVRICPTYPSDIVHLCSTRPSDAVCICPTRPSDIVRLYLLSSFDTVRLVSDTSA